MGVFRLATSTRETNCYMSSNIGLRDRSSIIFQLLENLQANLGRLKLTQKKQHKCIAGHNCRVHISSSYFIALYEVTLTAALPNWRLKCCLPRNSCCISLYTLCARILCLESPRALITEVYLVETQAAGICFEAATNGYRTMRNTMVLMNIKHTDFVSMGTWPSYNSVMKT